MPRSLLYALSLLDVSAVFLSCCYSYPASLYLSLDVVQYIRIHERLVNVLSERPTTIFYFESEHASRAE